MSYQHFSCIVYLKQQAAGRGWMGMGSRGVRRSGVMPCPAQPYVCCHLAQPSGPRPLWMPVQHVYSSAVYNHCKPFAGRILVVIASKCGISFDYPRMLRLVYFDSHIELHPTDTSAAGLRKPWRYLPFLLVCSELLRIVLAQFSSWIETSIDTLNLTILISLVYINCFD